MKGFILHYISMGLFTYYCLSLSRPKTFRGNNVEPLNLALGLLLTITIWPIAPLVVYAIDRRQK